MHTSHHHPSQGRHSGYPGRRTTNNNSSNGPNLGADFNQLQGNISIEGAIVVAGDLNHSSTVYHLSIYLSQSLIPCSSTYPKVTIKTLIFLKSTVRILRITALWLRGISVDLNQAGTSTIWARNVKNVTI
jgi:hypothetical protein